MKDSRKLLSHPEEAVDIHSECTTSNKTFIYQQVWESGDTHHLTPSTEGVYGGVKTSLSINTICPTPPWRLKLVLKKPLSQKVVLIKPTDLLLEHFWVQLRLESLLIIPCRVSDRILGCGRKTGR